MIDSTINFVCPNCLTVNRVPESRLQDNPICGKCKQPVIPDHPVELVDSNFQTFVSRTGVPVVVDFWAPWCGPCRMMAPAFAQAAAQLSPKVIFAKLNTDEAGRSAAPFDIRGIPCLIIFQNGKEVARQTGVMNAHQIAQWVGSL